MQERLLQERLLQERLATTEKVHGRGTASWSCDTDRRRGLTIGSMWLGWVWRAAGGT